MTTLSESSEGTGLFDCLTVRSPRALVAADGFACHILWPSGEIGIVVYFLSRASTKRNQGLLQRGVPKARTRGSFRISHVGVSRFEQFVRSDIFHYLATGPQFVHAACNGSPADDLKFQHSVSQEPTKLLGLPGPNSMCFILAIQPRPICHCDGCCSTTASSTS